MWPFKYPYTNFHELNLDWIIEEIKKSSEKVNDIPNIVNTAVEAAEMGYPFVNVKSYGAKGDGIADDTLAFQEALNSGCNVYVPMESREKYRITKTLNLKADGQVLFSMPHGWNYNKAGVIESSASPVIDASGYNAAAFFYLNFYGEGSGTCIRLEGRQDNTDSVIIGNTLNNYETGIEYNGRGGEIHNNFFGKFGTGILLNYSYNGIGGNDYQQPESGFRSFNISGNKFHEVSKYCIRTVAPYIANVNIINNIKDVGRAQLVLFEGGSNGSIISGNQIERDCIAIEYKGYNEKIVISNNIFNIVGLNIDNNTNPSIRSDDNTTIKDCVIENNVFSAKYMRSAVDLLGTNENVVISNNVFHLKTITADHGVLKLNHAEGSTNIGFNVIGNAVRADNVEVNGILVRNYGGPWYNPGGFIVNNLAPAVKILMSRSSTPGTVQPDNI